MADDAVQLDVFHGGKLVEKPKLEYVGGEMETIELDVDLISTPHLKKYLREKGYGGVLTLYYKLHRSSLRHLKVLDSDRSDIELMKLLKKHKKCQLYVDAPVDEPEILFFLPTSQSDSESGHFASEGGVDSGVGVACQAGKVVCEGEGEGVVGVAADGIVGDVDGESVIGGANVDGGDDVDAGKSINVDGGGDTDAGESGVAAETINGDGDGDGDGNIATGVDVSGVQGVCVNESVALGAGVTGVTSVNMEQGVPMEESVRVNVNTAVEEGVPMEESVSVNVNITVEEGVNVEESVGVKSVIVEENADVENQVVTMEKRGVEGVTMEEESVGVEGVTMEEENAGVDVTMEEDNVGVEGVTMEEESAGVDDVTVEDNIGIDDVTVEENVGVTVENVGAGDDSDTENDEE